MCSNKNAWAVLNARGFADEEQKIKPFFLDCFLQSKLTRTQHCKNTLRFQVMME
jgi:hypothetical protein